MQKQNIMSGQETKRRGIMEWWEKRCRSAVPQSMMCPENLRLTCFQLSGTWVTHSASFKESRKYEKACCRSKNKPLPAPARLKRKAEHCKRCTSSSWTTFKGSEVAVSLHGITCTWSQIQTNLHVVTTVQHSVASINTTRLLMSKY